LEKKTQICGIASNSRIDENGVDNVFRVSSRINSTWGGNLVDMVRCQKYIEIIEDEGLLEHVRVTGDYFLEKLIHLEEKYAGLVTNARGKGMFLAFDLPDAKTRNEALVVFREMNILLLSCGIRTVRLRPALSLSRAEVEEFISRMCKGLDKFLVN